jgi:hypothetical protein
VAARYASRNDPSSDLTSIATMARAHCDGRAHCDTALTFVPPTPRSRRWIHGTQSLIAYCLRLGDKATTRGWPRSVWQLVETEEGRAALEVHQHEVELFGGVCRGQCEHEGAE